MSVCILTQMVEVVSTNSAIHMRGCIFFRRAECASPVDSHAILPLPQPSLETNVLLLA